MIAKIYNDCKDTEINDQTLNSIYIKVESIFYRLLDKLGLMQKLLLEEEGPDVRRNHFYVPVLNPQNSSSVILAANTLEIDDCVSAEMKDRIGFCRV